MKEWLSLYESKSGERGVFNREAANKLLPDRRKEAGYTEWGTNPCSEIVLRSAQF
jgi:ribonucleoside-diphosphate reductase alpha chain